MGTPVRDPDLGGVAAAARDLALATGADADLCGPFVRVLGVSGAAVSTLGDPFNSETVCASGSRAARLDEIQIDLGEGPCWQALRTRRPVLEPDLERSATTAWPAAMSALRETSTGSVFAFPLVVAGIDVGAVDLYSWTPMTLSDQQVADAGLLSRVLARQVLHRALVAAEGKDAETGVSSGVHSRREVHQATGMVLAQLHVTPSDALLVLRGHAFSTGRSVLDVAADVVARTIDFSTVTD
ncbi:GAF and ANTAR domain-containing protein [Frigoribacterium salinisoli]